MKTDPSDGDPLGQDEKETLEAELRQAMQLQRAAYEQMLEAESALREVTARARRLLEGAPVAPDPPEPAGPEAGEG